MNYLTKQVKNVKAALYLGAFALNLAGIMFRPLEDAVSSLHGTSLVLFTLDYIDVPILIAKNKKSSLAVMGILGHHIFVSAVSELLFARGNDAILFAQLLPFFMHRFVAYFPVRMSLLLTDALQCVLPIFFADSMLPWLLVLNMMYAVKVLCDFALVYTGIMHMQFLVFYQSKKIPGQQARTLCELKA
jgi:hypothetical protein